MNKLTRIISNNILIKISIICLLGNAYALSLEDLQMRFAKHTVLRADFEQTRNISGISAPLVSKGRLIMSQAHGVWWQQETPFIMRLLLTQQKMVQTIDGQDPEEINAKSNPQIFQFNALLSALLKADIAVLKQDFEITFEATPLKEEGRGNWYLQLKPITSPLDKIFLKINLKGKNYINTIHIYDKQGDISVINFSNQTTKPEILNRDERNYFQ